jgi:hypothetical protein
MVMGMGWVGLIYRDLSPGRYNCPRGVFSRQRNNFVDIVMMRDDGRGEDMVTPSGGQGWRGNYTTYESMWRRFGCLGASSGGKAGVLEAQQGRQPERTLCSLLFLRP